jgi:hypothetical protein
MTNTGERQPPSNMGTLTGPFYDAAGVLAWLGVTRGELDKRRVDGTILVCSTAEGQDIFPAWQFQADGTLLPGLREVLEALAGGTSDGWTWALWLRSRVPGQLDGISAVQWLTERRGSWPLLQLAQQDASRWAQ